jgi:Fur family ferric uptake transcriptional regulator
MTVARGELHGLVEERMLGAGRRYTASRRTLVDLLAAARRPLAVVDLGSATRRLPQSSIYRNLSALETAGVVRRVVAEGDFARFELDERLTQHHHHLVCSNCGRVEDVSVPPTVERSLDRTIDRVARDAGFASVRHRLDLIGLCRRCA